MSHRHLIFILADWILVLFVSVSSDDLFENNLDVLMDLNSILALEGSTATQSTLDDFDPGLDMINFDDPFVGSISFATHEDDEDIFASGSSQNPCDAAAEASDLSLEARDGKKACPENPQGSSSSSPILSPDSIQLFQDPSSLLNNYLSPDPTKTKKRPSGSEQPPNPPGNTPIFYPGHLSDEDAAGRTSDDLQWDLNSMPGLTKVVDTFFCLTQLRVVPVCCDGPFDMYGNVAGCDGCMYDFL